MAININVSVEELTGFADSISEFSKCIYHDCAELTSCFQKLNDTIDQETSDIFCASVKSIETILQENQNVLHDLETKVRNYAQLVDQLKKTAKEGHGPAGKNTPKEKMTGALLGFVMHEHLKAADSEFQTVGGYALNKAIKMADAAVAAIGAVPGVQITPNLAPTDQAAINNQFDDAVKIIDGQMALDPSNRINREPTPIPQEQIDSHTLVIDDLDHFLGNSSNKE